MFYPENGIMPSELEGQKKFKILDNQVQIFGELLISSANLVAVFFKINNLNML